MNKLLISLFSVAALAMPLMSTAQAPAVPVAQPEQAANPTPARNDAATAKKAAKKAKKKKLKKKKSKKSKVQ